MSADLTPLLQALDVLVEQLPHAAIEPLALALGGAPLGNWVLISAATQRVLAAPQYRAQIATFLTAWQSSAPDTSPASVALALRAAAYTSARHRRAQHLELVWTGPVSSQPLRRTAQVLVELIDGAKQSLLIVSFAVYDIEEIGQALLRAAHRGVQIQLIIESPKASAGRLAYDSLAAFGSDVTARARLFQWPSDQRLADEHGRLGSLHAKCAVADEQTLLLSSANLTHYALNLNMELGVRIEGGPLPRQVVEHFWELAHRQVLVTIHP